MIVSTFTTTKGKPVSNKEWLRPSEAGQILGVSAVTASNYARQGLVESMLTPGNQLLIRRPSVEEWVDKHRRVPVSPNVTVIEHT